MAKKQLRVLLLLFPSHRLECRITAVAPTQTARHAHMVEIVAGSAGKGRECGQVHYQNESRQTASTAASRVPVRLLPSCRTSKLSVGMMIVNA